MAQCGGGGGGIRLGGEERKPRVWGGVQSVVLGFKLRGFSCCGTVRA